MGNELKIAEIILHRFENPDGGLYNTVPYGDICVNLLEKNEEGNELVTEVLQKLESNHYISPCKLGYTLSEKGRGYFRSGILSLK